MKALSVRQPWAWLICAGYKDIENRNWAIGRNPHHGQYQSQQADFSLTLPCRIYVHAGKDQREYLENLSDIVGFVESCGINLFEACPGAIVRAQYYGAIIGEVDIIACVKNSPSVWAEPGKNHFVLANPRLYDYPEPYRGQLGFFNIPDAVTAGIRERNG